MMKVSGYHTDNEESIGKDEMNIKYEENKAKNLRLRPIELGVEGATASKYVEDEAKSENFYEVDVLTQLRANVQQIEDLQFRLNFLMSEIRTLIKKA